MGTLAGILATAALSHLGGHAVGGMLARFGVLGFGGKVGIARSVLRIGRAMRKAVERDPTPKAREDLKRWLSEHDPSNQSGIGDGIV